MALRKVARGALAGAAAFALIALAAAPTAAASAPAFCADIGGDWDGTYCRATVDSERRATRDIQLALPEGLVGNPVVGDYLRTLMSNWKRAGAGMAADSYAEENFQTFQHGGVMSVVFHETYHADGPAFNNAYRTFTFGGGRQLQLADLVRPGVDPMSAIPTLGAPYIQQALDQAPPRHDPGSYPFIADRWTPDKVYSGGYKAWAITPDELILYMPDYPVAHDLPLDFTIGHMQWSMDGGTVQAHIPLAALGSILRPEYGGAG